MEGGGIDFDLVVVVDVVIIDNAVGGITHEHRGEGAVVCAGTNGVISTDFFVAITAGNKFVSENNRVGLYHAYRIIGIEICERLNRLGTGAIFVGLYADEGILIDVVADATGAGSRTGGVIGVEHREREVGITVATPTPVDVEETVAVVAVTDEGVSTVLAPTPIHYRPAIG